MENTKEIKELIEATIENKFNKLLKEIPTIINENKVKDETDFFNFSFIDLYDNTLKTIIDIINELIRIIDNGNNDNYLMKILNIFLKENRMFYFGIILIILSFVIYFIDGVSI